MSAHRPLHISPISPLSPLAPLSPADPTSSSHSPILTSTALRQLTLGWGAVAALSTAGNLLPDPLPTPALIGLLLAVIATIVLCARGVTVEAEHLARRLGEPYGTLVLTLSVVVIEVALISATLLSSKDPTAHTTIARDSVTATVMIVLNLITGIALLVGGQRHQRLRVNRTGVSIYLTLLTALVTTAVAVPALVGTGGAYTTPQAITIIALTALLYGVFLHRQTGPQRADFEEVMNHTINDAMNDTGVVQSPTHGPGAEAGTPEDRSPLRDREHRREIICRTLLLLALMIPIVLLSHTMASLLTDTVTRLSAPPALSGVVIAAIVFLPEAMATVHAAARGDAQRMSNLAHGALVSCVGLTVPVVLTIGLLTGHTVTLAESPANLLLLGVSLFLTSVTFSSPRVTASHGLAHLFLFAIYVLSITS